MVNPKFRYSQTVYHVCDVLQNPLIVVGVVHRGDHFTYLAASYESEKEYTEIELSAEKTIIT